MTARWLGERVTLHPYIEQRMRETASVWQKCPTCKARWFGQRRAPAYCMACDPTKEQVQPGVYRTRTV
jgi:hypothetical protein